MIKIEIAEIVREELLRLKDCKIVGELGEQTWFHWMGIKDV